MEMKSITLEGIRPMAIDPLDPNTIVRKAQAGDLEAFEWVIRQHERQVLGLCYHVLGNLEDAKDAAQDVFLKLHQQIGRFDYEREFAPWLLTVVRNLCRDRLRWKWLAILKQAIASLPERERMALEMRELEASFEGQDEVKEICEELRMIHEQAIEEVRGNVMRKLRRRRTAKLGTVAAYIKILTDDPNVVFLLVNSENGGTE